MAPHELMANYLASIELLAKQLRDVGETVSDTCLTTQILRSLPDKYHSLRQFKMLEGSRKKHNYSYSNAFTGRCKVDSA